MKETPTQMETNVIIIIKLTTKTYPVIAALCAEPTFTLKSNLDNLFYVQTSSESGRLCDEDEAKELMAEFDMEPTNIDVWHN